MFMTRSYRGARFNWWQRLTTTNLVVLSGHIVVGVWLHRVVPVVALAVGCALFSRPRRFAMVCLAGGLVGVHASNVAWREVVADRLGPYSGVACLKNDPTPKNGAIVVVLEIEGERFESWARGSPRRRMRDRLAGECAQVSGNRRALTGVAQRRAAIRHVVGGFDLETVGDWQPGTVIDRASNRVRRLFARGASTVRAPDDTLLAGLVIGDDRNEPIELITQFRQSGLSHLTAVSGQNVAFVLAAAAPLLRRLRPRLRWLATIGLIGWFVALTRFEPSVLRAGVMAMIATTGHLIGREHPATRVLALAVCVLVVIDPMLVWSVGFWLSVGATLGVAALGTPLAGYIPGPRWIAVPLGVTLGAQVGVAPVSLLVFGSMPLVSLPANLLAVPVAGFVMLYGLPAGLLAGALGGTAGGVVASVIQMPSALGTRWVATVAGLGARLEPRPALALLGWSCVVALVAARFIAARRQRI